MATSTRASLLAEADRLIHSQNYTKEHSARVEHLLKLADSMSEEHNALRKLKMQEILEHEVINDPSKAHLYRSETRQLSSVERDFDTLIRFGKEFIADERRTLSAGTGTAGGFLVPQSFSDQVWVSMKKYDDLFSAATVITDDKGNAPLPIPCINDTANVAVKIAENAQVTPADVATFSQVSLASTDTWRTNMQQVSMELVGDSAFDLASFLADIFGRRLAAGVGADFIPILIAGAALGKTGTTGQTTSVTYDDLVDLLGSINPAYIASDKCGWLMQFATLVSIMKLKASAGGQAMLTFDANRWTLFGKPVYICPSVPAMAANAKSILFGDLSRFFIRRVGDGIEVKRFNETYAEYAMIAYQGFMRTKAVLVNATGADSPIKWYANSAS